MNLIAAKTAKMVVKMLHREDALAQRLIPCSEAASRLGISPDRLRRLKDSFTHVKRGKGQQARLYFDADRLISEFQDLRTKQ